LFPRAFTFGLKNAATAPSQIEMTGKGSSFVIDGQKFEIPLAGEHNILNALAAIAVAKEMNVPLSAAAQALKNFKGVYRRYNVLGAVNGVDVVDDFAHNPHKLAASIKASQLRGGKTLAFFQPHAFASVKLLSKEFAEEIRKALRPQDKLWLTDVYYAGGTVDRSVKTEDIYKALLAEGHKNVFFDSCRENIAAEIVKNAAPGDTVLVMGARDPSLTDFAKQILSSLAKATPPAACEACLAKRTCLESDFITEKPTA
jgi:UDP-N-acetylmuramate--alanine ligase